MEWLDKVLIDVGGIHSIEYYDGCVETMYQTHQIDWDEYSKRRNWILEKSYENTRKLLERVK